MSDTDTDTDTVPTVTLSDAEVLAHLRIVARLAAVRAAPPALREQMAALLSDVGL